MTQETFPSILSKIAGAIDAGEQDEGGLVTVKLPASYARDLRLAAEAMAISGQKEAR